MFLKKIIKPSFEEYLNQLDFTQDIEQARKVFKDYLEWLESLEPDKENNKEY